MDKETFKNIEKRLYSYYEKEELIKTIKYKIEKLEKQIEQIDEDIKNNNVIIETDLKGISYGERVQSSSNGTSYMERELVKAIERLEREKDYKLASISDLKREARELEESSSEIEYNIKKLNEMDLKFIELKYKKRPRCSIEEVALELNMSRSAGYDKRDKLINYIGKWIIDINI